MPNPLAWRSNEAAMSDLHEAYLNLGSNIEPEINLVRGIQLLRQYGNINEISTAWESKSVGSEGPNFLNICALFVSEHPRIELKKQVIRPIEIKLGRKRNRNKFSPRTIDIDIILFDGKPTGEKYWELAFVIIPLAEIYPEYRSPITQEKISEMAMRFRKEVWMKARPEISSLLRKGSF